MNKAAGGPVNPQLMTKDNSLFVVETHKNCEFFRRFLTRHTPQEGTA